MSVRLANFSFGSKVKTGHLFMGLSLVFAVLTGFMIRNIVLERSQSAGTVTVNTRPVVVANDNIPVGTTLNAQHLRIANWPSDYLPSGITYQNTAGLMGRVARRDLHPGEPIYSEVLSGESSTGGLKVLIPKGLRAMTVAVTEVKGVAGFVKPGDRVDVIATFKDMGGGNVDLKVTKTVLQNVQVIAAAQQMTHETTATDPSLPQLSGVHGASPSPAAQSTSIRAESGEPAKIVNSVTLAITPSQIETLALADETGTIRLVLRPETDNTIAKLFGVTPRDLLNTNQALKSVVNSIPQARRAAPSPLFTLPKPAYAHVEGRVIELIDGTEKSSVAF